ncbi:MAG: hypothetical protein QM644_16930 [Mobilitalea sp.]
MSNKELYIAAFDQIHASAEVVERMRQMKHCRRERNIKMKYAVAAILVVILIGSNAVTYAATGKSLYSFMASSSLIQGFFNEGNELSVAEQIEKDVSYVEGQSLVYENYLFTLYRYYAEKNSGIVLAEFCITDLEGNQLSAKEMEELEKSSEAGINNGSNHFEVSINNINGSIQSRVYADKDGNSILALSCMVALLGSEDTQVNTDYIDNITELIFSAIDTDGNITEIGTFQVPSNPTKIDSLAFEVSENPKLEYAVISGMGMQLIFNINIAKAELEKELEASGRKDDPDYDPEAHRYTLYKNLSIIMKDGTEYRIRENGLGYTEEDSIVSHGGGHPYEYSTGLDAEIYVFNKLLDVSQVNYLKVDGKYYKVQN